MKIRFLFYRKRYCMKLKQYPVNIIPIVHIVINTSNNLGFIAFLSMIIEGRLKVVTAIIKDRTVPNWAPLNNKDSAMGTFQIIIIYVLYITRNLCIL